MNLKTLAVVGLAAAGLALGAGAADAKTKLKIGIGIGTGCEFPNEDCYGDQGGGYGDYGDPGDHRRRKRSRYNDDDNFDDGGYDGLSCGEARRILRGQGWRRVRPEDCSGRRYSFTGWRHGEPFSIRISRSRDLG
jgi:hypothetical protein